MYPLRGGGTGSTSTAGGGVPIEISTDAPNATGGTATAPAIAIATTIRLRIIPAFRTTTVAILSKPRLANVAHEQATLSFPDLGGDAVFVHGGGSGGLDSATGRRATRFVRRAIDDGVAGVFTRRGYDR
jgi:hypothetical protein